MSRHGVLPWLWPPPKSWLVNLIAGLSRHVKDMTRPHILMSCMLGCISMLTCLEGISAYACCHAPWHPDMDMHVVMSPGKMPGALEMPGGMSTCICMSIYQDQGASQHEKNMHFRMPGGHVKMHILPSQEGGCESRKQGGWEARKEWVCCVWVQARRHTKV